MMASIFQYIFGGRSDETGQSHTSQDIYDDKFRYLDLSTLQWHLLDVKGDQKPCGRRSHTMWTYQGNILLFGGFQSNRNVHFGDLWRFNPKYCTWTEIVPTGNGNLALFSLQSIHYSNSQGLPRVDANAQSKSAIGFSCLAEQCLFCFIICLIHQKLQA